MWDAVHRNLLDLEDHFEGKVIRNGFASRPVFHGTFNKIRVTVNFSTSRLNRNRYNFIDISFAAGSDSSLTVIAEKWYSHFTSYENPEFFKVQLGAGMEYLIKPVNRKIQQLFSSDSITAFFQKYPGFVYCFIASTGTLIEIQSEELIADTHFDKISPVFEFVQELTRKIK